MKKNILLLMILSCILCGCGKKAVNTDEFSSLLTEKGYKVENVTEKETYKETYIAYDQNDYQIKLLIIDSTSEAKRIQSAFRTKFINLIKENDEVVNVVDHFSDNYNEYGVIINDTYYYIIQVDNTCIKVEAPKEYLKDVNKIVKELVN